MGFIRRMHERYRLLKCYSGSRKPSPNPQSVGLLCCADGMRRCQHIYAWCVVNGYENKLEHLELAELCDRRSEKNKNQRRHLRGKNFCRSWGKKSKRERERERERENWERDHCSVSEGRQWSLCTMYCQQEEILLSMLLHCYSECVCQGISLHLCPVESYRRASPLLGPKLWSRDTYTFVYANQHRKLEAGRERGVRLSIVCYD